MFSSLVTMSASQPADSSLETTLATLPATSSGGSALRSGAALIAESTTRPTATSTRLHSPLTHSRAPRIQRWLQRQPAKGRTYDGRALEHRDWRGAVRRRGLRS